MTTGTAVATQDGRLGASAIIAASGLNREEWTQERIALVRRILPHDFRDDINLMGFLAKVAATGLDPFSGEIWAWEQDGKLQTMTGRDGFILVARRDPDVVGLKHGLIYTNDEFHADDDSGGINIVHQMPAPRGALSEAYCVAKMRNGLDHIERRSLEDYRHLLNKSNWRNHPQDMLLARTIGACVRVVCPNARGLYTEADDFGEPIRGHEVADVTLKTEASAEALRARLTVARAENEALVAESEIGADADAEPDPQAESVVVSAGMDAELAPRDDGGPVEAEFDCEYCREYDGYNGPFQGQRAWAGHCRSKAHKARVELAGDEAIEEEVDEPAELEPEPEPEPEPEGMATIDLYRAVDPWVREGVVGSDVIPSTINDPQFGDMFEGFRRSGQDKIGVYDLTDEARLVLFKVIRSLAGKDA